uniref:Uncharacterized protein n=1 Tax=Rangifer tarandus platyrhynchus TaxID=3082113 RepID=A0ACB0FH31_RANTA|nr:unnamed protein product [Rangifer tarandus platyrhynchus]
MRKPNPLQDANFCSRLFFWWLNPLFKIGHKRRLEEDDMYAVLPEDHSQHLGEELQGNDVLALSVGGAIAGYHSDCLALDGNRNVMSCWDGGSHFPSAVAKLLWDVVFITLGKTAALTDERIRTVSEFISGIRTVKMYAWEKSLIDLVTRLRRKEISKILKSSYLRGMNLASFFVVTKIMIFVTFITNGALDKVITASQVFVMVTLYEALRFTSTLYFPMAIDKVSEAIVSIRRIKDLQLLKDGDLTVIGDRGTPLSEGQKACVNLARCIHQALKEKITILVTHQWQFLKDASQILILKNGKIIQKGTLVEFPKFGVDFEDILLKKKNEEGEPSPGPGAPSLNSESSVQFQQSPRPSLKDAAPEDQDDFISSLKLEPNSHIDDLKDEETVELPDDFYTSRSCP